eukprot:scaffold3707_cov228-Pinguiococcus_pyrenoidosus.AAC.1
MKGGADAGKGGRRGPGFFSNLFGGEQAKARSPQSASSASGQSASNPIEKPQKLPRSLDRPHRPIRSQSLDGVRTPRARGPGMLSTPRSFERTPS